MLTAYLDEGLCRHTVQRVCAKEFSRRVHNTTVDHRGDWHKQSRGMYAWMYVCMHACKYACAGVCMHTFAMHLQVMHVYNEMVSCHAQQSYSKNSSPQICCTSSICMHPAMRHIFNLHASSHATIQTTRCTSTLGAAILQQYFLSAAMQHV
jgi:hypothetical protein